MVALVGPLTGERRAAHTAGYPLDSDKMLPIADVVLLIADGDRSAMLFRYTAHGDFGGDTLHGTVVEAQEQASFEYEDALMPWVDVPGNVGDAHKFAIQYAAERLDSRGEW